MNALPSITAPSLDFPPEFERPAQPVMFGGLAGMYHAAVGSTAILFISPWGFEELCSRRFYCILAEKLAVLGYPSLRFDLPGTCHSAGLGSEISDERAWRKAVRSALDYLQASSQPQRTIVIGQGIGGLLGEWLARECAIDGLVLLAPPSQGRSYLREVAAWTAMTKPDLMVSVTDGPEGGLMSAGFVLSADTVNEIKSLKPGGTFQIPQARVLLVQRAENGGDAKLVDALGISGALVDQSSFKDYTGYLASPTLSIFPEDVVDNVLSWVHQHFPPQPASLPPLPLMSAAALIEEKTYRERLFRFGPADMFFGALTEPTNVKAKTAVLILNAGADHSSGWARYAVDLAREVAAAGFAVMRMDLAGVGESGVWPDQDGPTIYSLQANDDVRHAIDFLVSDAGIERIVLFGRCSGAYQALLSVVANERVNGVFIVNIRKLHWDSWTEIDTAIREPTLTLDVYRKGLVDPNRLKRLLSGELRLSTVFGKLKRALLADADKRLAPFLRRHSKHFRMDRAIRQRLQVLKDRKVAVALVYGEGDRGLLDLYDWAGADGAKLGAYPNVTISMVDNADHNFTPLPSRIEIIERLRGFLEDTELR